MPPAYILSSLSLSLSLSLSSLLLSLFLFLFLSFSFSDVYIHSCLRMLKMTWQTGGRAIHPYTHAPMRPCAASHHGGSSSVLRLTTRSNAIASGVAASLPAALAPPQSSPLP